MTLARLVIPQTLPTTPLDYPAMDYDFLRREGIKYLERMAGQVWTDFNVHDPGITILEQVCYAITDLAHRINYSIPDLLTREGDATYDSLYDFAQVLTTHPVTINDLRKLVIDVQGVKNAWIEKLEPTLYYDANRKIVQLSTSSSDPSLTGDPIKLQGLYRVLVELTDLQYVGDSNLVPDPPAVVLARVSERLHTNRSLGEDFEAPVELLPQPVQITATIEIDAVDDTQALLLQIYQQIANYVSPSLQFSTYQQLYDAGKSVDEIFDGPLLEHGFIDNAVLAQPRRTSLRTSDLINLIMNVPGVRLVKMLKIAVDGGKAQPWSVDLDPQRAPKFDLAHSLIQLERNQVAVSEVVSDQAKNAYWETLRASANAAPSPLGEPQLPTGWDRNVADYYSIQHQFPAVYGIGSSGLSDAAPVERQAQAKQLKAYLLFFDQLLANYFEQLSHLRDLFSFSTDSISSYFSRAIDDPTLALDGIRSPDLPAHQARLQHITDVSAGNIETQYQRRNRFLNHLLARFAEQFTDYSLILYSALSTSDKITAESKLIQDKQAFLMDYPTIGSTRGTAFNYWQPWSLTNSSGLEKRLRRKLGLNGTDGEAFYIVEHILLRPIKDDEHQSIPILIDASVKDPYSLQLSFVFPANSPRFKNQDFRDFIERTIREETPAHLVVYIHWFNQAEMDVFVAAYNDWLTARTAYVTQPST